MLEPTQIAAGLAVGFTIGLTGIGGGSLMTPLLILVFDVRPVVAVGTDLLYAAITKSSGIWVHQRRGHVNWRVVGWLAAGSMPSALLTLWLLHRLLDFDRYREHLVIVILGVALVLTAFAVFAHHWLQYMRGRRAPRAEIAQEGGTSLPPGRLPRRWAAWGTGAVLGLLVTASSVGAGALGTACLLFLYPALRTATVIGTDLAHAVPLTAIAGLGHLQLGTVDLKLLLSLLIGSVPGVYLGGHVSGLLQERTLRLILAVTLLLVGTGLCWKFLGQVQAG